MSVKNLPLMEFYNNIYLVGHNYLFEQIEYIHGFLIETLGILLRGPNFSF